MLDSLHDIRCALRLFRKSPAFVCAAVATLAIGIGANVAVFSLIDRIVLHPLPVSEPSRLVTVRQQYGARSDQLSTTVVYDDYLRARETSSLAGVAAAGGTGYWLNVSYGDGAMQAPAVFVSANYFGVLGVRPRGRDFEPADDTRSADPVAIVTDTTWRTRLGTDSRTIGSAIVIGGTRVAVVGIAPPGFAGTELGGTPPEMFLPLMTAPRLLPVTGNFFGSAVEAVYSPQAWLTLIARLRPGVGPSQAQSELNSLLGGPGRYPRSVTLVGVNDAALPFRSRDDVTRLASLLAAAVGLTLLIGCANLAGLLLARVEGRRTELAVRAALGADRWRLGRQLAVEAAVIAMAGGVMALLAAIWIEQIWGRFELPGRIAISTLRTSTDARTLVFALAATAVAAILCGVAPAAGASRRDLVGDLRRQGGGATARLLGVRLLVGVQVAICILLVFGAALFARSLRAALDTRLGFDTRGLIVTSVNPPARRYTADRARVYVDAILAAARAIPGVETATIGPPPIASFGGSTPALRIDGVRLQLPIAKSLIINAVGDRFFTTLRQPLASGRDFTEADTAGAPAVAIVNESAARRFWPGQQAIGHRITFLPLDRDAEVVGIVKDVKYRDLREEGRVAVYLPRQQQPALASFGGADLVIRSAGASTATVAALRRAAASLDSELPLSRVRTIDETIGLLLMPQRLGTSLLGWLGIMAVALTVVGIYGLIACVVARSTREIGVRVALGADRAAILRHVTARAIAPVAAGAVAGGTAAWWAGRFADRFMYRMSGSDPVTLAGAAALLVAVAVVATLVPARRALHVDPIQALRAE